MTSTRRRWTLAVSAVMLVLFGAAVVWIRSTTTATADAPLLDSQTVSVGDTDVTMTPVQLDEAGAQFRLALDTHSGSLDIDLPGAAQVRIAGATTNAGTWDGPGPGDITVKASFNSSRR